MRKVFTQTRRMTRTTTITLPPIDTVAARVHATRDTSVSFEQLPDSEKDLLRGTVRAVYEAIGAAGNSTPRRDPQSRG